MEKEKGQRLLYLLRIYVKRPEKRWGGGAEEETTLLHWQCTRRDAFLGWTHLNWVTVFPILLHSVPGTVDVNALSPTRREVGFYLPRPLPRRVKKEKKRGEELGLVGR